MTISDEPDEDAASLDDEQLLDFFLAPDAVAGAAKADVAPMADWPPSDADAAAITSENKTIEWFKANHTDWSGQIAAVLRAWVDTREAEPRQDPGNSVAKPSDD